jgi:isocitrate dehydrogenase (NAD+)
LVGGLGLVPGANYGDKGAIFEAVHGTAPDIAGKGIANPIAMILSSAMMLDYIGHQEAGNKIRAATGSVLRAGRVLTRDVGGKATTEEVTAAIIKAMRRS